ncbi:MAG: thioredoxin domain-containing protein [Chloroflexota bacterium]
MNTFQCRLNSITLVIILSSILILITPQFAYAQTYTNESGTYPSYQAYLDSYYSSYGAPQPQNTYPAATPVPARSSTPVYTPSSSVNLPAPLFGWSLREKPIAQQGNANAPVTIVKYGDFMCTSCANFFREVKPSLNTMIAAGQVRYIFKHLPATGNRSIVSATFAECAGRMGNFWTMHDWLYNNQHVWSRQWNVRNYLLQQSGALGYNTSTMASCVDGGSASQAVQTDYSEAKQYHLRQTPTFLVNGRQVTGYLPWSLFQPIINTLAADAYSGQSASAARASVPAEPVVNISLPAESYGNVGSASAPVTIYLFIDYQCRLCRQFFANTLAQFNQAYVATNKARIVYKDFPVTSQSRRAAEATECAGEQGQFGAMQWQLVSNANSWQRASDPSSLFSSYAATIGLNAGRFNQCMNSGRHAIEVQTDKQEGQQFNIQDVPTFFVNGRKFVGAPSFAELQGIMASLGY